MRRSTLTTALAALLVSAALLLAGCGVGSGSAESKISDTTDTYLRSLAGGDGATACAQLTAAARRELAASCPAALEEIAARVGRERLQDAADEGSSISVDGVNATATLRGLNDARLGLVESESEWLIESGYALDEGS